MYDVSSFDYFSLSASSPGKASEAKSNDIIAMISPEGERVALGKVGVLL